MRVLLFTGKGGVGKTTLAAATAARLAAAGRKTLVVSTDPAHSLGDALDVPLSGDPSELSGADGLFASQLDVRRLVDGSWQQLRTHLRTLLAGAGVDELDAEELTVLPGVEELLALSEVYRLAAAGPWEVVVVDCGPTAETLRLLALPEALSGYLERLFPTHRRVVRGLLAGIAGARQVDRWDAAADALSRLAERLEALRAALADRSRTSVRLVLTPERVVAAETRRTLTALAVQGVRVDGLIANRLIPVFGPRRGASAMWLHTRRDEQQAVLDELAAGTDVPMRTVPHLAAEPVGVPALLALAEDVYVDDDPLYDDAAERSAPLLSVSGSGRGLQARYRLRIAVPLAAADDLDLARVGDELALTVDGRRRLFALPPVLRRCEVTGADVDGEGMLVHFQPDPALWPRSE
ncbi:MAG TPA: TRC40/GET3/ArsA family transport-energizing ATPase [Pseudonocardiaceae bacterium]|nr:TRC40/GET3/ArsA family transport-energizing ATPase [Pseudonocardiaceae bacterium]